MSNLKIIMDKDDLQPLANNLKRFVGMDSSTTLTLDEMNEIVESNIGNLGNGGGVTLPTLTNEGFATDLLSGKQLINSKGMKVTGTMPNNGSVSKTIDGLDTKSVTIPAGYTSGGTVSISNKIDNLATTQTNLLSNINNSLDDKVVVDTITVQRVDGTFRAGNSNPDWDNWAEVPLPWQPDILILYLDGFHDTVNTNTYGRIESNIVFNLNESNYLANDFVSYDSNYLRRMDCLGWSEISGGLVGAVLDFNISNNTAEIQCYIMTESTQEQEIISYDWNAIFNYRAIKYT